MGFHIVKSALTIMIPMLFAATGGLFPALAGTLNIALEGMLLAGAFVSLTVYYFTGSVVAAITGAIIATVILCLLHSFAAFRMRANIFICGLAINLLSGALCVVFSDKLFSTKGVVTVTDIALPGLTDYYLILAVFLLITAYVVINKTPFGYRLRSCGKTDEVLISLGINPVFYKFNAMLISAVFCGIGGSFLSLNLGSYVPNMSAGKGWIALVLIFLGGHKPFGIFIAAFIFGLAESFSNHAQGIWRLPADLIFAFPYICALLAMIIWRKRNISY